MNDGGSYILTIAVLFGVGLGIVRWMPRIRPLEERIRNWSVGLGIVSGFVFWFSPLGKPSSGGDLADTVIAAVMAGIAAGLVWFFTLAALVFAYQYVLAPPFRLFGRWRQRAAERRARRTEEKRRRQEQQEYARMAPLQEQARRDAEAQKSEAQRRRDDALASCELLYHLYAPDIGARFPRQAFDDFAKKFLADKNAPPEDIERRAQQLRQLMEHHREQVKPMPKFSNIQELARWFQEQKSEIESLAVDDRVKRTLLASLNERNAELMTQLVGNMEPGRR